jgi:hypothetical protein
MVGWAGFSGAAGLGGAGGPWGAGEGSFTFSPARC